MRNSRDEIKALARWKTYEGGAILKVAARKLFFVLSGLLFVAISHAAFGQEFSVIGDGRFAEMTGAIEIDADKEFSAFLNSNPNVIGIRLNSPGGIVVNAIAMAEEISKRRLSTFIAEDQSCASACAILFFAGYDRLVKGRLGVHQMDDGGRGDASTLQFVLAEQLDAFQRFGVPWTVTHYMLTTPPWEMRWLSDDDIENLALNRDLPGDASEFALAQPAPKSRSEQFIFSDYPPHEHFTGQPRLPDFSGRDSDYRMYRTRIREGAARGVNFAGHYSIVEIGCGTSCRFAFVVDLRTGEVGSFPHGGEENYQMKLLYSPDSRLLKVRWMGDINSETCTEQDMLVEGLRWQILDKRPAPIINGFCDY
ncbi:hypothetical protein [Microbaculum sp. FT89]|uniref:hypothetical protein n=1 Tax=Microbaculum sp. FT89 TaxID=3447298 RepID=UPI003F53A640